MALIHPMPINQHVEILRRLDQLLARTFLYVHLEATNACNTVCKLCPRSAMTRRQKLLNWDTFLAAMKLILPSEIPMLSIVGFGEPTLHPRIGEMISFVRSMRPDMLIKLTTNGTTAPDRMNSMFAAGLDLLELSVFGVTPEEYETLTGGLSFRSVKTLIGDLNRTKRKYLVTTVPTNGSCPSEIRKFWMSIGARHVEVKGLHRRGGHLRRDPIPLSVSLGSYKQLSHDAAGAAHADCHKLLMFLHLNCDGQIVPCVQDINGDHMIGHISEFADIDEVFRACSKLRPIFPMCNSCEISRQDLRVYYADFLIRYFPSESAALP